MRTKIFEVPGKLLCVWDAEAKVGTIGMKLIDGQTAEGAIEWIKKNG